MTYSSRRKEVDMKKVIMIILLKLGIFLVIVAVGLGIAHKELD